MQTALRELLISMFTGNSEFSQSVPEEVYTALYKLVGAVFSKRGQQLLTRRINAIDGEFYLRGDDKSFIEEVNNL